jgi:hypothetical protein
MGGGGTGVVSWRRAVAVVAVLVATVALLALPTAPRGFAAELGSHGREGGGVRARLVAAHDYSNLLVDAYVRHGGSSGGDAFVEVQLVHTCILAAAWRPFLRGRPEAAAQRARMAVAPPDSDPEEQLERDVVSGRRVTTPVQGWSRLAAFLNSEGLPWASRLPLRNGSAVLASVAAAHALRISVAADSRQSASDSAVNAQGDSGLRCRFYARHDHAPLQLQLLDHEETVPDPLLVRLGVAPTPMSRLTLNGTERRAAYPYHELRRSWAPSDGRWTSELQLLAETQPVAALADPMANECSQVRRGSYLSEFVQCSLPAAVAARLRQGDAVFMALADDRHAEAVLGPVKVAVGDASVGEKQSALVCTAPLFSRSPLADGSLELSAELAREHRAHANKYHWLMHDWLTYHVHAGVARFVVYNMSFLPTSAPWLDAWRASGRVEVVQWPFWELAELDMGRRFVTRDSKGRRILQGAALAHCYRRFGQAFNVVMSLDTDEFLTMQARSLAVALAEPWARGGTSLHVDWFQPRTCNYSRLRAGEHLADRCEPAGRVRTTTTGMCARLDPLTGMPRISVCGKAVCSPAAHELMFIHDCIPWSADTMVAAPSAALRVEHFRMVRRYMAPNETEEDQDYAPSLMRREWLARDFSVP